MTRIHERIETALPIDAAFDYIADFANSHAWDPGTLSSRRIGSGPVGAGARYLLDVRMGDRVTPMEYRIREFERPTRVVLSGSGSNVDAVDEIRFERVGDATVIDYTADIRLGGLLRFAQPFLGATFAGSGATPRPGCMPDLTSWPPERTGWPADARRDRRWRRQRLSAAYALHRTHDVRLYDAEAPVGGHVKTVTARRPMDQWPWTWASSSTTTSRTRTFLAHARGARRRDPASEMSLGSACRRCDLEFSSRGLRGWFAPPSAAARPGHWRMFADILRFYRDARKRLDAGVSRPARRSATSSAMAATAGVPRAFPDPGHVGRVVHRGRPDPGVPGRLPAPLPRQPRPHRVRPRAAMAHHRGRLPGLRRSHPRAARAGTVRPATPWSMSTRPRTASTVRTAAGASEHVRRGRPGHARGRCAGPAARCRHARARWPWAASSTPPTRSSCTPTRRCCRGGRVPGPPGTSTAGLPAPGRPPDDDLRHEPAAGAPGPGQYWSRSTRATAWTRADHRRRGHAPPALHVPRPSTPRRPGRAPGPAAHVLRGGPPRATASTRTVVDRASRPPTWLARRHRDAASTEERRHEVAPPRRHRPPSPHCARSSTRWSTASTTSRSTSTSSPRSRGRSRLFGRNRRNVLDVPRPRPSRPAGRRTCAPRSCAHLQRRGSRTRRLAHHVRHQPAGLRLRVQPGQLLPLPRHSRRPAGRRRRGPQHARRAAPLHASARARRSGLRRVDGQGLLRLAVPRHRGALHGPGPGRALAPAHHHQPRAGRRPRCCTRAWTCARLPLTDRSSLRLLLRHPLVTHKTIAAIHWHALRLWLRGAPFHRHRGRPMTRPDRATRPAPDGRLAARARSPGASAWPPLARIRIGLPDRRRCPTARAASSATPTLGARPRSHIHDRQALVRLLLGGETGGGEAYMDGLWSSPDLAGLLRARGPQPRCTGALGRLVPRPGPLRPHRRAPRATQHARAAAATSPPTTTWATTSTACSSTRR